MLAARQGVCPLTPRPSLALQGLGSSVRGSVQACGNILGLVQDRLWTDRRPLGPVDRSRRALRRHPPSPGAGQWRRQAQQADGAGSSNSSSNINSNISQAMQEVDAVFENQRFFGLAWCAPPLPPL